MLAGKFRRALERAIGANVGVNDSRRGTRGQLVGGTVEVQVAGNSRFQRGGAARPIRTANSKSAPLENHKGLIG